MSSILISGVGRSGTTTVYDALQQIILRTGEQTDFVYEPYLWDTATFNRSLRDITDEFQRTDSIHIDGVYCHAKTPLFLPGSHPIHDAFVRDIVFKNGVSTLAKAIRCSGRLQAYLDLIPELKIIHIVRNPIDAVNSVVGLFSFLGGDLVPSDKNRFALEIKEKFADSADELDLDNEITMSRLWWRCMNQAALETAEAYPDRVMVISYDAYRSNKGTYMKAITDFCGIQIENQKEQLERPAGPITHKINIGSDQVQSFEKDMKVFWNKFLDQCQFVGDFNRQSAHEALENKYKNASGHSRLDRLPRNRNAIFYRNSLLKGQYHGNRSIKFLGLGDLVFSESVTGRLRNLKGLLKKRRIDNFGLRNRFQKSIQKISKNRVLQYLQNTGNGRLPQPSKVQIKNLSEIPDITCLVTSFNNAEFLQDAVMSVVAQSCPVKTIIIADDGSTDGSRDLISNLSKEYDNIRSVFRDKNLGPALNRHLAIKSMSTPFITQLDGDDYFQQDKIAAEVIALDGSLTRISFSDIQKTWPNGKKVLIGTEAFAKATDNSQKLIGMAKRDLPIPRDMLFSKQLYMEAGGYDSMTFMYEDWGLKLRLAKCTNDWVHSGTIGTIYRQTHTGLSAANKPFHAYWQLYCIAKNYDWLHEFIPNKTLLAILKKIIRLSEGLDSAPQIKLAVANLSQNPAAMEAVAIATERYSSHSNSHPTLKEIDQYLHEFADMLMVS